MGFSASNLQDTIDLLSISTANDFDNNGDVDANDAMNFVLSGALNLGVPATSGVSIGNVDYEGATNAAFVVEAFISGAFPDLAGGLLLSTGDLPDDVNDDDGHTVQNVTVGDADLTAIAQTAFSGAGATQDAATVSFDLINNNPDIDGLSIDIVFGSEEYPEFSNSDYIDVAALIANGSNYGLFNGDPATPLSVTDANLATGNFIDNTDALYAIEWDGFSNVLTVRMPLVVGSNDIFFGVADTGDMDLDSGLYLTNFQFLTGGATGGALLTVVDGTDGDDVLTATPNQEEFNLLGATDVVQGSPENFDGDFITGFGPDDTILVQGVALEPDDLGVSFGSAILEFDGNVLTLEGNFEGGSFDVSQTGAGTEITFMAPAPVLAAAINFDLPGAATPDDGRWAVAAEIAVGATLIAGTPGDDDIRGTAGVSNFFVGEAGNDSFIGRGRSDLILGNRGDDDLFGANGHDVIFGGRDDDTLSGGNGDDVLSGDRGSDVLEGGNGNDAFVFKGNAIDPVDIDEILDFTFGDDIVALFGIDIGDIAFVQAGVDVAMELDGTQIAVFRLADASEVASSTYEDPFAL